MSPGMSSLSESTPHNRKGSGYRDITLNHSQKREMLRPNLQGYVAVKDTLNGRFHVQTNILSFFLPHLFTLLYSARASHKSTLWDTVLKRNL